MSTRNDFLYFPDLDELLEIIAVEQQRELPLGKETIHYPDFSSLVGLLDVLDLDSSFFTSEFHINDLKSKNLPQLANILAQQFTQEMLSLSDHAQYLPFFDHIYDYLSEEDDLEPADLAFIFGSKTTARLEKAIELYKQGHVKKLVLSGKFPIYEHNQDLAEADEMKAFAESKGISSNDLIIENGSISIPDNVRSSLNLFDQLQLTYNSIILVNSPYSQRRGWAHFKKYLPESVKIIRVNATTQSMYAKESWFTNENGIRAICNELVKMKIAVILNTA